MCKQAQSITEEGGILLKPSLYLYSCVSEVSERPLARRFGIQSVVSVLFPVDKSGSCLDYRGC